MLRPTFVVFASDGAWKIRHDGRHYGPYPTERSAILAAIDAADRFPNFGHEARVMTQSRLNGQLYVEWTVGDPLPPDFEVYRMRLAETREGPIRRKGLVA